jgi:Na+/H+ antiporter NhaD/arsenite permease-like protein
MSWAIALIFGLTYALIAARRLAILPIGRPAGALAGAVAMVAVGALTPEQSFAAIDYDTLALLLGMMLLSVYLERSGSFARLTAGLLRRFNRPMSLLMALSVGAAGLSAFLVNDTVCLFATPLVVRICVAARLPFSPFLLALASSANIGSAATLVGNPQNMIIGGMSGLGFLPFMTAALPAVAVALAINLGLLWALFRGRLPATMPTVTLASAASDGRLGSTMVVMTGVIAGLFAGLHPGYVALGGAVLLMLRDREEPNEVFLRVDWSLLLFFAALFVVVAGARSTGGDRGAVGGLQGVRGAGCVERVGRLRGAGDGGLELAVERAVCLDHGGARGRAGRRGAAVGDAGVREHDRGEPDAAGIGGEHHRGGGGTGALSARFLGVSALRRAVDGADAGRAGWRRCGGGWGRVRR